MFTARKKIHKDNDADPSEFEESVAQALFDLENTNSELKSDLKDLYINSAIQVDVSGNRKAVVVYVPYRLRKAFRKIHLAGGGALFDLENTNSELKSDLKDLYINSAIQVDVSGNRKAVVVYVPYRLRKAFRKIHLRLVRELEKKFSGKVGR
ncbi:40S ribosomal protein S7-like [Cucurbita pepo subsp. pepo]|uniref:40S ribosomal protein S7-like n=1 Tax=Cucurbita pepo subsp. pepo TaxID=3664 RepID=UPI000C9D378F|nr:40S ribosomal protein S7-like [Cucurbita pepo subsp. pepo]